MHELASTNLVTLRKNAYPGRGIVIGLDDTGEYFVQVYWIMGRSENSRNRVFGKDADTGRVFTEAADSAKVRDPSLIIYNAMAEIGDCFVVSNGDQTDTVIKAVAEKKSFGDAMRMRQYEPDDPNYTPRISAVCLPQSHVMEMAVLRKSPWDNACDRHFYCFGEIGRGLGFCITTYSGNGNPLPAFQGEPYLLPLQGDLGTINKTLWNALDSENRVALVTKFIHRESSHSTIEIINKFSKVVVT